MAPPFNIKTSYPNNHFHKAERLFYLLFNVVAYHIILICYLKFVINEYGIVFQPRRNVVVAHEVER